MCHVSCVMSVSCVLAAILDIYPQSDGNIRMFHFPLQNKPLVPFELLVHWKMEI